MMIKFFEKFADITIISTSRRIITKLDITEVAFQPNLRAQATKSIYMKSKNSIEKVLKVFFYRNGIGRRRKQM